MRGSLGCIQSTSETAIVRGHGTDPIDANHTAVLICRRTTISELHVATAYRHDERQEVQHQGGHAGQLAAFPLTSQKS